MGGKSAPSNNQMVAFEMQQAQDAADKENLRQARLNQGKAAIDQLFSNQNFPDSFYQNYQNAELNYTQPQLQQQYDQAKAGMTYDLARAGTLRSTAAGYAQGLLEQQNAVNQAGLQAKADSDTAALRQSIASEQQQAYNQLYATEDPTVAANTAASSVANAQLQQPNLNPLGDMFKPVVIGMTSAIPGIYGASTYNSLNTGQNPASPFGTGAMTTSQT